MLQKFNRRVDELRNSILTTDNYVDKYLGFKMTNMTIQTLREIFRDDGEIQFGTNQDMKSRLGDQDAPNTLYSQPSLTLLKQ